MNLINSVKGIGSNAINCLSHHSPEILMVVGVVGTVTATVMACKATLKANEVIEETKKDLNDIHIAHATVSEDKYSETDYRRDLVIAYTQSAVKFVKLYGPSLVVGACSIGTIFISNDILRKRAAEITAAYVSLDNMYKKYRKGVIDAYGEDVDYKLRNGISVEKIKVTEIDEDGEGKTVSKKVDVIDEDPSGYSFFFDGSCLEWTKNREYNLTIISGILTSLQDMLDARTQKGKPGHLYLSEVYDAFGVPDGSRPEAERYVGWMKYADEEDKRKYAGPNYVGDGYIDLGIKELYKRINDKNDPQRYEPTILLDPNVDGVIIDKVYPKARGLSLSKS